MSFHEFEFVLGTTGRIALERQMIGDFCYASGPDVGAVSIFMRWDLHGERSATIVLDDEFASRLRELVLPHLLDDLTLPSALSYGIFIALKADVGLVLCGDRTVRDERWGELLAVR